MINDRNRWRRGVLAARTLYSLCVKAERRKKERKPSHVVININHVFFNDIAVNYFY